MIKPIKTKIITSKMFDLLGCVYYGDPFHEKGGWSAENEIGLTWKRFMVLNEQYKDLFEKHGVSGHIAYEIHLEPAEYKETKKFYVFVGREISDPVEIPLELFRKVLPETDYAVFTFKGKDMFKGGTYIWDEWLTSSGYEEAHPFVIQAYDDRRFHGLDDSESELDYLVPIKKKGRSG